MTHYGAASRASEEVSGIRAASSDASSSRQVPGANLRWSSRQHWRRRRRGRGGGERCRRHVSDDGPGNRRRTWQRSSAMRGDRGRKDRHTGLIDGPALCKLPSQERRARREHVTSDFLKFLPLVLDRKCCRSSLHLVRMFPAGRRLSGWCVRHAIWLSRTCLRRARSQFELIEHLAQRRCLPCEVDARRGAFLRHGSVLLGRLVHRVDRDIDLLQAGGLLARRFDDRSR